MRASFDEVANREGEVERFRFEKEGQFARVLILGPDGVEVNKTGYRNDTQNPFMFVWPDNLTKEQDAQLRKRYGNPRERYALVASIEKAQTNKSRFGDAYNYLWMASSRQVKILYRGAQAAGLNLTGDDRALLTIECTSQQYQNIAVRAVARFSDEVPDEQEVYEEIISYLPQHAGRVVTFDELMSDPSELLEGSLAEEIPY